MTLYTCQYCKKGFKKETTLAVHVCEPKKRYQERDETGPRLGLQAYLKFYELTQGSAKPKTFDDFAASPYYSAFVKFGQYCVSIRAINPLQFTLWLLKNNKKIDHWCKDSIYTEYLMDYLKVEAVADALTRAIEYSIDWADKTDSPSHDCLRYGNTNAMCYAISTGRISPWVVYNCESGQKFLSELNTEQVALIWSYINSDFWQKKFKDYPEDTAYAKEILQKAGW
jgi:hypothetical protein